MKFQFLWCLFDTSCGILVENWEAEDDVRSSRWHLTDCKFIQGEDSGNVPIGMCAMRQAADFPSRVDTIKASRMWMDIC